MIFFRIILLCVVSFLLVSCKDVSNKSEGLQQTVSSTPKKFEFTNELKNETSPYLLQHAHNPVNWMPWGDEAFEKAKAEQKLIILSIGYSSCHWCHVMEEESFQDTEIAELMNSNFVNIKVDREELPDVDMVYQTALQLVKGSGGWPLNAIIFPDGKPVYLGTYHDKESWGLVLTNFSSEYKNNPLKLEDYAEMLANGVQEVYDNSVDDNNKPITKNQLEKSVLKLSKTWDNEFGGNLGDQKFVMPSQLNFLLDYSIINGNENVRKYLKLTLDKILLGGIRDHIGGGFFRYSTDYFWKVPHFEKMLYDNAQILSLYSKAYRVFKDPAYKQVILSILNFLDNEMQSEDGAYLSAIDADVRGQEGGFYLWDRNELEELLGEDFEMFSKFYAIKKGNEILNGKFLPFKSRSDKQFASVYSISESELKTKSSKWNEILVHARKNRLQPNKDDKIITSWNALVVKGFIEAYMALGKEEDLQKAKRTFDYLLKNNYKNNKLMHSSKRGSKRSEVFLEDYAFMVESAILLYKVTLERKYLNTAKELNQYVLHDFSDNSGFFKFSPKEELITEIISTDDGVLPSANAIMAKNLLNLGHILYDTSLLETSKNMVSLLSTKFQEYPESFGNWGALMLNNTYPYFEVVVVGDNGKTLLKELNKHYIPNMLLVGSVSDSNLPLFKNRYVPDETFVYVCQNNTCKLPVRSISEVLSQFQKIGYYNIIHN